MSQGICNSASTGYVYSIFTIFKAAPSVSSSPVDRRERLAIQKALSSDLSFNGPSAPPSRGKIGTLSRFHLIFGPSIRRNVSFREGSWNLRGTTINDAS